MYTLYGGGYTRAHMIEMVFAEVDVPFEVKLIDTFKGENRSPQFLEINPAGFVPALRTPEGAVLFETPAINLYIAERHGTGLLAPAIDDPDRGLFLSSLFYIADELEPALKRYFYPHRYGVRESDDAEIRGKSLETIRHTLGVINKRLTDAGPFHLGDRYSLVDLVLSFWMYSIMDKNEVSHFDAVNRCVHHVQERPVLQKLFVDLEERTKAYAEIDKRGERIP
jgi:glutathione S-transferase